MWIWKARLNNVRCFEDTGDIVFSQGCNIFTGKNNTGKTTLLKAIFGLQTQPFNAIDVRSRSDNSESYVEIILDDVNRNDLQSIRRDLSQSIINYVQALNGVIPSRYNHYDVKLAGGGQSIFNPLSPGHQIIPFLSRRKSVVFNEDVSTRAQDVLDGTFYALYSRIDRLATWGHPNHDQFKEAVKNIVGLEITMMASANGKVAGFYFDSQTFITLDRMGDGVTELVALIVDLCTAKHKTFVLEEPETSLHPSGLKAILEMIRSASEENQFFVATHSNVVVRELGGTGSAKLFRVIRDGDHYSSPSRVEEVDKSPAAHMEILKDLGYEFADFNLHEGWLFLEEASAEFVIRDILIPFFVPELQGRLRTFSAGGVTNLEPAISDFQRLIVFVHLQPVYKDRIWVRADGDEFGIEAIKVLEKKYPKLGKESLKTFSKRYFEEFYPLTFQDEVYQVMSIQDKKERKTRKLELLEQVIKWTGANKEKAKAEWHESAKEPIEFLLYIRDVILRK